MWIAVETQEKIRERPWGGAEIVRQRLGPLKHQVRLKEHAGYLRSAAQGRSAWIGKGICPTCLTVQVLFHVLWKPRLSVVSFYRRCNELAWNVQVKVLFAPVSLCWYPLPDSPDILPLLCALKITSD
mmetsp:Transcript_4647/g.29386  ORF Transcript_4647/g.29386 Transcript_4647/m.29386 type:complete len:127 (-) Transcript_4647:464-844(-)